MTNKELLIKRCKELKTVISCEFEQAYKAYDYDMKLAAIEKAIENYLVFVGEMKNEERNF